MTDRPSDDPHHAAIDEIVRELARRENLLATASWDGFVATMKRHVAFGAAGVTLRDGADHYRIVALSTGPGYDLAPFQQRLPVLAHTDAVVYREGRPYVCDDTRAGAPAEQILAHGGYLSYALIPMHRRAEGEGDEVFGDVLFAFAGLGEARAAPMPLLVGFADAVAEAMPRALETLRIHRLARIFDQSEKALVAWDAVGCVIDVNEAAARLCGRPEGELRGRPVEEILGEGAAVPTDGAGVRRTLERPDGSRIVVDATVWRAVGDPLVAGYALLRDLTDVVLAEQRLVQADRLATLGMLAAGVAHEINNPAAFLLLGLDLVGRRVKAAEDAGAGAALAGVDDLLRDLRESTERIVAITRDLRLFASPSGAAPIAVDVARAVESALTLVRAQILERADLEVEVEPGLPPVRIEQGRIAQVLVNLLVNAVQSIPKGLGREVVRVEARRAGGEVRIEVADTGQGIPPEDLDRMWAPFFTTKEGQGTGLGLSISRGIVERAGGTMSATSPSGLRDGTRGARFTVTLPASTPQDSCPPSSSGPPLDAVRPRRSVLLVEDEPALARALVEQLGVTHDVTHAARGDDAVRVLASRSFDAVLCDLRMPGLSGEAVYERVAARDPAQAARFVFMTGVGIGAETKRFLDAVAVPLLEKPFPLDLALRAIARVTR